MKFAHIADSHIGCWREDKLKRLSFEAFSKAVDICIEKNVDFILISGDLFNNSLPSIDLLKLVTEKLKLLKDKGIGVYIIPGSHDFSPSGKTIIDVLDKAGLVVNVARGSIVDGKLRLKFFVDKKTGAKITGIPGRAYMLDKSYFEILDRDINETGFKIFMFHNGVQEFLPKNINVDAVPLSLFPKGFDYYAGGHIHYVFNKDNFVFPGPLFPTNFSEIEELRTGGFFIYDNGNINFEKIKVIDVFSIDIDCNNKSPSEIYNEIVDKIKDKEFLNTIVTIRLHGVMSSGKPSDIDMKNIIKMLENKSSFFVMRNTSKLISKDYEEIKTVGDSVDEVEENIINENIGQIKIDYDEKKLIHELMDVLGREKKEGQTSSDFEKEIVNDVSKILGEDIE